MRVLKIEELAPTFRLYRCGSPNQKDFLIENGMEYVYSYRSNKTGRLIWVFIECERLTQLLNIWTANKPGGEESDA